MPPERYGDQHRYFLQGIMSRGIMNGGAVKALFSLSREKANLPAVEGEQFQLTLVDFIKILNRTISEQSLKILKQKDEASKENKSSYVLVSLLDRSDDIGALTEGLTKFAMVDFQPHELEYLKIVLAELMESEEKVLDSMTALSLCGSVKTKKVGNLEGERILSKFQRHKWLDVDSDGVISMAPRFLAEMGPYLEEHFKDNIANCKNCKQKVYRCVQCGKCSAKFHRYCVGFEPNETKAQCKSCKDLIFDWEHKQSAPSTRKRGAPKMMNLSGSEEDSD